MKIEFNMSICGVFKLFNKKQNIFVFFSSLNLFKKIIKYPKQMWIDEIYTITMYRQSIFYNIRIV